MSSLMDFYNTQSQIENAINKGYNRDRTRLRRNAYIKEFLSYYFENTSKKIYWFTFTFNDESLNKERKKLRESFTKYLKRNNLGYMLFSDYGNENERFHLHGFVVCDSVLQGNVYNLYGYTTYREVYSINGYECITAQFYLSQKNYDQYIDRLWKHMV